MLPLTKTHRDAQLAMRAAALRDLLRLWPALDLERLDRSFPAWSTAVSGVVTRHRAASIEVAGAYVRGVRAQHVGLRAFDIIEPEALDADRLLTSMRVTSVVAAKRAMARGATLDAASRLAFVKHSGAMSRFILDAGRDTITQTVRADERALGWQRVASGRACAFCALLVSRGAVYREDTARFASHDHCACTAEPIYDHDAPSAPGAERWAALYTEHAQGASDPVAAFRRAYDAAAT